MGTHLKVLGESYLMNTNMTGFGCFSKEASALEGLKVTKQLCCAIDSVSDQWHGSSLHFSVTATMECKTAKETRD